MEKKSKNEKNFSQTLTIKGIIVAVLTLLLLIPNAMIMNLIQERAERSKETVSKINEKWSRAQTICGPILTVPFISTAYADEQQHELYLTPNELNINTQLYPEERYYSVYKTILYKSEIHISGQFSLPNDLKMENCVLHFDKAYIALRISDLRGVSNQLKFKINNKQYTAEAGNSDNMTGKKLITYLKDVIKPTNATESFQFECQLNLNGSSDINFIPVGNITKVDVDGDWKAPGFIGNFTPAYKLTDKGFHASWSILSFNRSIPDYWIDKNIDNFDDTSFGVNLVDMVDHYQQNMRSAKYSLMFIALTFVVFFFVEILTKKRIHPIQYLLVGIALILFYSLLLSISEQINFAVAYLIASIATIILISAYANSVFKNKMQTGILSLILCSLYIFLYTVLQLEDAALLIGSIGLFVILGVIMFVSRKIKWYKQEEENENQEEINSIA